MVFQPINSHRHRPLILPQPVPRPVNDYQLLGLSRPGVHLMGLSDRHYIILAAVH
jgi:hypothetical protein